MANRTGDPILSFRFMVEIDGLTAGGFSEVSGLDIEIELESYQEGGMNDYVHFFPKGIKHPKLVLKKGITHSSDFMTWFINCAKGTITRKNGAVIMLDDKQKEVRRWNFYNAYPVKCTGPGFKAVGNDIAIESFELIHQGLDLAFTPEG